MNFKLLLLLTLQFFKGLSISVPLPDPDSIMLESRTKVETYGPCKYSSSESVVGPSEYRISTIRQLKSVLVLCGSVMIPA